MQGGSQDVIWRFFGGEKKASDARTSAGAPRPAPAIAASTDRTASSEATAVLAPIADSKASSLAPPRTRVAGTGGSSAPGSDAAALFAQANRVRRSGDHSEAVGLYRALLDRYPHSAEAHEAQAALGRLLFSDGNANAALRCFDEYLHASGPLEEDVRVDRAQALGRLHRFSEETEAWSSLLQAHPTSVHADRARSRLRDLGDR
jgi:TolA-binding protein